MRISWGGNEDTKLVVPSLLRRRDLPVGTRVLQPLDCARLTWLWHMQYCLIGNCYWIRFFFIVCLCHSCREWRLTASSAPTFPRLSFLAGEKCVARLNKIFWVPLINYNTAFRVSHQRNGFIKGSGGPNNSKPLLLCDNRGISCHLLTSGTQVF